MADVEEIGVSGKQSRRCFGVNSNDSDLYEKITGIINGKIKFDKKRDEFVYSKGKESHSIVFS
jgi:hypothetical protein